MNLKEELEKKVFGFKVWVVTVEDLIISKLKWTQDLKNDQHISDIENLISVPEINEDYIKKWWEELELKTYSLI